jgi:hypothetical protein
VEIDRRERKNRRLLFGGAAFVLSALLAVAGIEIGFRATGYYRCSLAWAFPPLYASDPALNHVHLPDASVRHCSYYGDYDVYYHTDTRRHRTTTFPAVDGRPAVLLLGDSYTFGFGVADQQTFAARLQALRPDVRVINFGVSSYTIDQETAVLRDAQRWVGAIDRIVLQVTPANDFSELAGHRVSPNRIEDLATHVDDTGRLVKSARHVPVYKQWLRHAYLYRFVTEGRGRFGVQPDQQDESDEGTDWAVGWGADVIEARSRQWMSDHEREVRDYFAAADAFFAAAAPEAVIVVLLPARFMPTPGLNPFLHRQLLEYFTQHGATVLDVDRGLTRGDYLPRDPHFSARGHRRLAEQLSRALQER